MKRFIGTKTIEAEPMDECTFLETKKSIDCRNRETRPGYLVRYPDGYESWSPKDVFEEAYSELVVGINATAETLLKTPVFPSEILSVGVAPDPDYGGAHQYQFQNSIGFKDGVAGYDHSYQKIQFVQKNIDEQ
jgi:hypothetical protein